MLGMSAFWRRTQPKRFRKRRHRQTRKSHPPLSFQLFMRFQMTYWGFEHSLPSFFAVYQAEVLKIPFQRRSKSIWRWRSECRWRACKHSRRRCRESGRGSFLKVSLVFITKNYEHLINTKKLLRLESTKLRSESLGNFFFTNSIWVKLFLSTRVP